MRKPVSAAPRGIPALQAPVKIGRLRLDAPQVPN
jgi:hypothetical protein